MDRLVSSEDAVKSSLLYLYQSFREGGMSEADAKKEVGYFVVDALFNINCLAGFKVMVLDSKNTKALEQIQSNIELLVKSPQPHISSIGKSLAEQFSSLLD